MTGPLQCDCSVDSRSHRRHQGVHHGPAHVGHADRLDVKRRPALGLMDQPFTGERYWSDRRRRLLPWPRRRAALKTRACASLAEAKLACTTPEMFKDPEEHGPVPGVVPAGSPDPLRNRLLRLLPVGHGTDRPGGRGQSEAVRHRSAHPHHRDARAASSPVGREATPARADAWWPQAIRACTRRR